MLDTALRCLPLVCKVGLSLTVDNTLEFWLSTSGLSCRAAEMGAVWLILVHCEMLDYILKPELTKEDINLSQDRFSFPFNTKLKFNFFSKY